MQHKPWFLYFGRLEKEKWFDLILQMIRIFSQTHGELPFFLYIFWTGQYTNEILELASHHRSIHFFWRQPLENIKRYKDNCQYCLMPSTFLETFWLSALTALSRDLPVIWFAKGWLEKFILPEYDITKYEWSVGVQKLCNMMLELIEKHNQKPLFETEDAVSKRMQTIVRQYDIKHWIENIRELFGTQKKILLVSDFKNKVGWIETYMRDAKAILEEYGYEVEIFWKTLPSGSWSKIMKYLGIAYAVINIVDAIKLLKKIKKEKYDIVRFNSVLGWLWWLPIWITKFTPAKKYIMYHDFWYVYPFPHALQQVSQIPAPCSLKNYIRSANTKNPIMLLWIIGKYLSLFLIQKAASKVIKKYLVPSKYMEKIFQNAYNISEEKITSLSHFIQ